MTGAAVVGVGMTRFGKHLDTSLSELARIAVFTALADAQANIDDVDMVFVANAMASLTTGQVSVVGQSVLRPLGFSDIPVFNIDNACAASSSALNLAVQAVAAGAARTVLVLGVEKLYAHEKGIAYRALNGAMDTDTLRASGVDPARESGFVSAIYPERFRRYRDRWGLDVTALAEIAVKNRFHAALNPLAQYTAPLSVDDVLAARTVVDPLTTLMCAPIGDGAAALVVTGADDARAHGRRPVWIRGSAIGMGATPNGTSSVARVARRAYDQAGITPDEVDVAEVHDSISFNELAAYEELGLCEEGQGGRMALDGETRLGGRVPVNTSGGLTSRGHPVAATGAAQIVELVHQLRHDAADRQVADACIGVAENAGGFALDDTAAIAITVLGTEPAR